LVYGEFGLIKNLLFKVFICLLDEHPKKFSLNFMWPFKVFFAADCTFSSDRRNTVKPIPAGFYRFLSGVFAAIGSTFFVSPWQLAV
jgi:hypothetical protein